MRIVVLGAGGQIGRAVFKELKSGGHDVVGTSRKALSNLSLFPFDPFAQNWAVLGNTDVLINCIGAIQEERGASLEKVHIQLVQSMLQNRWMLGQPKIIHLSALGASPTHPVHFLCTKGLADEHLLAAERTHVIRPSIVCTPGTVLVQKIKMLRQIGRCMGNHLFLPKGFLQSSVQPVLLADLTALIVRMVVQSIEASLVEVAGPEPITYQTLIDLAFHHQWSYTEIAERRVRPIVKTVLSSLFPSVLNWEQYQLLFSDNVSSDQTAAAMLERKLGTTWPFWLAHLA